MCVNLEAEIKTQGGVTVSLAKSLVWKKPNSACVSVCMCVHPCSHTYRQVHLYVYISTHMYTYILMTIFNLMSRDSLYTSEDI